MLLTCGLDSHQAPPLLRNTLSKSDQGEGEREREKEQRVQTQWEGLGTNMTLCAHLKVHQLLSTDPVLIAAISPITEVVRKSLIFHVKGRPLPSPTISFVSIVEGEQQVLNYLE